MNKHSFDNMLKKLNLKDELTKAPKLSKIFTHVKDQIPHKEDFNFMADLLFLPKTSKGYLYVLVVVDLYTDEFDMEPIKNKQSTTVLKAMKKMFKRKYLKKPYASISTDSGGEFKFVFHKYLNDNDIYHKVSSANRHTQMANVESLNKQIGRLFNLYMNKVEEETGKPFNEWTKVVDIVRQELNNHRIERNKEELKDYEHNYVLPLHIKPKFNVGDIVHYALDKPRNGLNKVINTDKFRVGDYKWSRDVKKVNNIYYYSEKPYYRYGLETISNKSFTDNQLKKSSGKDTTFNVKKIIGKKMEKKKTYYNVWWEGYLKKDSTWELKQNLIKDGLKQIIDEYENKI